MQVHSLGYFTKDRRIEPFLVEMVKKHLPQVLSPEQTKQVKKVKLIFFKNQITDWVDGYKWLWKNGEITIKIARNYRSKIIGEWVILHELVHVKQLMEGRLNRSLIKTHYLFPKKMTKVSTKWDDKKRKFLNLKTNAHFGFPPWEREANRIADRHLSLKKQRFVLKKFG